MKVTIQKDNGKWIVKTNDESKSFLYKAQAEAYANYLRFFGKEVNHG